MKAPKVIFLGAHPRLQGLIDIYGIRNCDWFSICDRGHSSGIFAGMPLHSVDDLDLRDLHCVIVTEDPILKPPPVVSGDLDPGVMDEWSDAIQYMEKRGVGRDKIVTVGQAGKLHRAIARQIDLTEDRAKAIAYALVRADILWRGNYAYGMILAAEAALRMGLTTVSAIEFGVWFGAGLRNLCEIAELIADTLGVEFLIYGFDTGQGLPEIKDYRDHPELWNSHSLVMPNHDQLRRELPGNCHLIIGDVRETVPEFIRRPELAAAPVAFVSLDVDQYHSSVSALKVFSAATECLLPVIPVWVDDSYLNVLQSTWAGEGLAIRHFNDAHDFRKIEQKIIRTDSFPRLWHHCFYFAHIFDHPVRQGLQAARFDGFLHTNY